MIRERIEEKLRAAFQPVFLEVVDESYRHNVPAGSESHFKVVLVSDLQYFSGGTLYYRSCAGSAYLHY